MSEHNLWEWLRGVLPPSGHYSRVESPDTSPGFPDVDYAMPPREEFGRGAIGKLELKFSLRPTAKKPFNDKHGLRKSQKIWIRDYLRVGGIVSIVAQIGENVYLLDGHHVQVFNMLTLKQIELVSAVIVSTNRKTMSPQKAGLRIVHYLYALNDGEIPHDIENLYLS